MSKKYLIIAITFIIAVFGLGSVANSANAEGGSEDRQCTVHHDAVTHIETVTIVDEEAYDEVITVIDEEAYDEVIEATPDLWWNWSPNDTQGPQDYEPLFPVDDRGTWQGPHENGGPWQDTYGTFNVSNEQSGNSSWFHREMGMAEQIIHHDAITHEETVHHPAVTHDETNTVVDQEAYSEVVDCDEVPPLKDEPRMPVSITNEVPVPTVVTAGI